MNSEINNTNLDSKCKNLGGFLFYLVQMLERLEPENRSILPHLTVQKVIRFSLKKSSNGTPTFWCILQKHVSIGYI